MFGQDFSNLPPQAQWIAGAILAVWAVYQMLKGLTGPKPAEQVTGEDARQLAMKLADSELRNDLSESMRITKDGLQQQILQLAASLRTELGEVARHNTESHSAIYDRMNEMDRDRNALAVKVAALEARRPGARS